MPGYGPCRTPEEPPSVPDEGAPLTRGVGDEDEDDDEDEEKRLGRLRYRCMFCLVVRAGS